MGYMNNATVKITDVNSFCKKMTSLRSTVCERCGAFICDAMDLAKELNTFLDQLAGNVTDEILVDTGYTILGSIIEPELPFDESNVEEWLKWEEKNIARKCAFLKGYECDMYISYSRVCVFSNESCDCFSNFKQETANNDMIIID